MNSPNTLPTFAWCDRGPMLQRSQRTVGAANSPRKAALVRPKLLTSGRANGQNARPAPSPIVLMCVNGCRALSRPLPLVRSRQGTSMPWLERLVGSMTQDANVSMRPPLHTSTKPHAQRWMPSIGQCARRCPQSTLLLRVLLRPKNSRRSVVGPA